MIRKIEFPITARVIVVNADQDNSIRDIASLACLDIEQRVNARGDIRIHVTLDETQLKTYRYSEGTDTDRAAGFELGDPVNHNPPCPDCHLCNALVPRMGMLKCRSCGYTETMTPENYMRDMSRLSVLVREAKAFLAWPNTTGSVDEHMATHMAAFGLQMIDATRAKKDSIVRDLLAIIEGSQSMVANDAIERAKDTLGGSE